MYCECGCGELAPIAKKTANGNVEGQPLRFIRGHWSRKPLSWTEVDRGYSTLCWEWDLARGRAGYGTITRDGRNHYAHRWLYEQVVGPVPEGLELDHLCRVRECVNPDHLEPVTHAENQRRARRPRRVTLEQVAEIQRLRAEGVTTVELARRFGIGQSSASRLSRGAYAALLPAQ